MKPDPFLAIVDFNFAYKLKQSKRIYIITGYKRDLAPLTIMPRVIDQANPVNALVTHEETLHFDNTPGSWRRITSTCPGSDKIYVSLTNEMNLSPGVINQCRRVRWNIEKAFDQQEPKLMNPKRGLPVR